MYHHIEEYTPQKAYYLLALWKGGISIVSSYRYFQSRSVTVRFPSTREAYYRAWSLARRLIKATRGNPAMIERWELLWLRIELDADMPVLLWSPATQEGELVYQSTLEDCTPPAPPVPQLHMGAMLALPWR